MNSIKIIKNIRHDLFIILKMARLNEVNSMIYKLINYVKGVKIENDHGVQVLTHESNCYENSDFCVEVTEVAHNEIQVKVLKADSPIQHIYVDFINPMENVKATLDSSGNLIPITEGAEKENQYFVYTDYGTYAIGLENGFDSGGVFRVDPNEIHLDLHLENASNHDLPCYRLAFEKYLACYSGPRIVERFNHLLGY